MIYIVIFWKQQKSKSYGPVVANHLATIKTSQAWARAVSRITKPMRLLTSCHNLPAYKCLNKCLTKTIISKDLKPGWAWHMVLSSTSDLRTGSQRKHQIMVRKNHQWTWRTAASRRAGDATSSSPSIRPESGANLRVWAAKMGQKKSWKTRTFAIPTSNSILV